MKPEKPTFTREEISKAWNDLFLRSIIVVPIAFTILIYGVIESSPLLIFGGLATFAIVLMAYFELRGIFKEVKP